MLLTGIAKGDVDAQVHVNRLITELRVPVDVVREKCTRYMIDGKPTHPRFQTAGTGVDQFLRDSDYHDLSVGVAVAPRWLERRTK